MESPPPEEIRPASSPHRQNTLNPNYKGRVRTGCLVCRARKVKCDEGRPSCQKCTRLERTCVYRIPSRWEPPQTPTPSTRHGAATGQPDQRTETASGSILPPQDGTDGFSIDEPHVFLGNASAMSTQGMLDISSDARPPDPEPRNMDESPSNHTATSFQQDGSASLETSPSDRFQHTSQLIYLSATMDWLAATEVPTRSSFRYFNEVVDCPLISSFDRLGWERAKNYIALLALQHSLVADSLLAVQTLYRAQVDRLSMSHAMSVYQTAVSSFEAISAESAVDFDVVLAAAFLLCICVATLPNDDGPCLGALNGVFATSLEAWLLSGHRSPISLRICAWLQILNTATKRPGSPGLLSEPVLGLLYEHVKEVPSLSEMDRDTHPERSLYDTVATPVFQFYLRLQRMSNRVADVTHYRRSRNTPSDQAEVTELMDILKTDLASLWENRPAPLRLQPDKLREYFSPQISDPLIALSGACIAAFHTETIVIGRILGDPPFPSPEAKHALAQIRSIVDGDWNVLADDGLNPGLVRPLFVYALESFQKEESQWAADRLGQIKHPMSRSAFLASFVEAHGEAQRAQQRRVTMKYFCYQTFGVPLPFM